MYWRILILLLCSVVFAYPPQIPGKVFVGYHGSVEGSNHAACPEGSFYIDQTTLDGGELDAAFYVSNDPRLAMRYARHGRFYLVYIDEEVWIQQRRIWITSTADRARDQNLCPEWIRMHCRDAIRIAPIWDQSMWRPLIEAMQMGFPHSMLGRISGHRTTIVHAAYDPNVHTAIDYRELFENSPNGEELHQPLEAAEDCFTRASPWQEYYGEEVTYGPPAQKSFQDLDTVDVAAAGREEDAGEGDRSVKQGTPSGAAQQCTNNPPPSYVFYLYDSDGFDPDTRADPDQLKLRSNQETMSRLSCGVPEENNATTIYPTDPPTREDQNRDDNENRTNDPKNPDDGSLDENTDQPGDEDFSGGLSTPSSQEQEVEDQLQSPIRSEPHTEDHDQGEVRETPPDDNNTGKQKGNPRGQDPENEHSRISLTQLHGGRADCREELCLPMSDTWRLWTDQQHD